MAPLYLDNEEPHLHIKFYDIPGIGEKNNVGREELDMMIDGQLKTDVEVLVQNKFKHQDVSVCLFWNKVGTSLYSLNKYILSRKHLRWNTTPGKKSLTLTGMYLIMKDLMIIKGKNVK